MTALPLDLPGTRPGAVLAHGPMWAAMHTGFYSVTEVRSPWIPISSWFSNLLRLVSIWSHTTVLAPYTSGLILY